MTSRQKKAGVRRANIRPLAPPRLATVWPFGRFGIREPIAFHRRALSYGVRTPFVRAWALVVEARLTQPRRRAPVAA